MKRKQSDADLVGPVDREYRSSAEIVCAQGDGRQHVGTARLRRKWLPSQQDHAGFAFERVSKDPGKSRSLVTITKSYRRAYEQIAVSVALTGPISDQ
jgi:hypothetical protein